jgi:hypothetical protein
VHVVVAHGAVVGRLRLIVGRRGQRVAHGVLRGRRRHHGRGRARRRAHRVRRRARCCNTHLVTPLTRAHPAPPRPRPGAAGSRRMRADPAGSGQDSNVTRLLELDAAKQSTHHHMAVTSATIQIINLYA